MEVEVNSRPGSSLVPAGKCTLCGYPVAAEYEGTEYVLLSPEGKEHQVCQLCVEFFRAPDILRRRMLRYIERLEAQARSLRRGLKYEFVVKDAVR